MVPRATVAVRRVVKVALGLIPWVAGEAGAFRSPQGHFDHIFPVSQITPFEITPLKGSESGQVKGIAFFSRTSDLQPGRKMGAELRTLGA